MTVAGDVILKVVASFVVEGLHRGYEGIKGTIRRRQAVDRALSGDPPAGDPRLNKAVRELETIIGSARGQLTESVAAFIREIERSAIPESLSRCILADRDTDTVYPAFELIYRSFSGQLSFDPKIFFDAFCTAIRCRLEFEVKDPTLLEFVQAKNKDFSKQLSNISSALQALSRIEHPLTVAELADGRVKLARTFEVANRLVT